MKKQTAFYFLHTKFIDSKRLSVKTLKNMTVWNKNVQVFCVLQHKTLRQTSILLITWREV